jgi:diguanylate cyclase (GGDEF)-like protein/PAS domain S-box-containing protein
MTMFFFCLRCVMKKTANVSLREFFKADYSFLKDFYRHFPDAVFLLDSSGVFIGVNKAAENLTGFSQKELEGSTFEMIMHPEDDRFVQNYVQKISKGLTFEKELRIVHASGKSIDISVTIVPLYLDGEIIGAYSIAKDMTEKNMLKQQNSESEKRFRLLIQHLSDVIAIINQNGTIEYKSPAVEKVLGFTYEELKDQNLFHLIHPEDLFKAKDVFVKVLQEPGKTFNTEVRLQHKTGKWIWIDARVTNFLNDQSVKGIVINYRDVTERKKSQDNMYRLAYYDFLTKLPNRRLFEDYLKKELKQSFPIALMMIDIDDFKHVNDTFGFDIGDKILKNIGDILNKTLRPKFLARISGDRFALMLDIREKNEAEIAAKKLLKRLEKPIKIEQFEFFITVSIGICLTNMDTLTRQQLIANAEIALYSAKGSGKNNFQFYHKDLNVQTYKRFALKNDLRKAIKNEEFFLLYQPRMSCQTKQMKGVEALLRWNHPTFGVVSPNDFINIAEETGLIVPLGNWVLEKAIRQLKEWEQMGLPPLQMSINFSPLQFAQSDLVAKMKKLIKKYKIEPRFIEIEITESLLLDNNERILKTIKSLRSLGIKIAVDDFGTGYSSFGYVKKFIPNTLKIDKSFTDGITSIYDREIIHSIIQLGNRLQINIVAEGVETPEQLKILQTLKCHEVQGYLFSKPIPADEIAKIVNK